MNIYSAIKIIYLGIKHQRNMLQQHSWKKCTKKQFLIQNTLALEQRIEIKKYFQNKKIQNTFWNLKIPNKKYIYLKNTFQNLKNTY